VSGRYYTGIGSRGTPASIEPWIEAVAKLLNSYDFTLRSGAAEGADEMFERHATKKQIFLPWPEFNGNRSPYGRPSTQAMKMAQLYHPTWWGLKPGARLLHARNVHQILGPDLATPSEFVVCWAPDEEHGGTSQAIRIARAHELPVVNLALGTALSFRRTPLPQVLAYVEQLVNGRRFA